MSIVLLRRIATALNVSLAELFATEAVASGPNRSIQHVLERLSAQQLNTVAARLMQEFGASPKDRHSRIALIGLRGAGKSTLGAKLAKEVKAPFIELDREIEKEAGMPLRRFFRSTGNPVIAELNIASWSASCGNTSAPCSPSVEGWSPRKKRTTGCWRVVSPCG